MLSRNPEYYTYHSKRTPFYATSDKRGLNETRDVQFYNMYMEVDVVPATGEKTYYIKKRPGIEMYNSNVTNYRIRGCVEYNGVIYFVFSNVLSKYDGGHWYDIATLPSDNGSIVGMTPWLENTGKEYIVFGDGNTLWAYDIAGASLQTPIANYPTPFLPQIQSIDGYIAMVKRGTQDIYTSQVQDIMNVSWDFISAELYPDNIIAFARYKNYLVAMGSQSTELFYDAAIAEGSPLARNDSTVITVGCSSPNTPIQIEDKLYWLGSARGGQLGVWELSDFKVNEITDQFMRKQISGGGNNNPANYTTSYLRVSGKRFLIVGLSTGSTTTWDQVWVYDLDEKVWAQWDFVNSNYYLQWIVDDNSGYPKLITPVGMLLMYDNTYTDLGNTISCYWVTSNEDLDTYNRKMAHRLSVIGDINGSNQTIGVSWSDDDYQTWSTERQLNLSSSRPALVNLGSFRRRAWKFTYNGDNKLRLIGMELYYNMMVN